MESAIIMKGICVKKNLPDIDPKEQPRRNDAELVRDVRTGPNTNTSPYFYEWTTNNGDCCP